MNAKEVFDHIEKIAATASKLEKLRLVKEAISDPLFLKVVTYAYDPFKTFGLAAIPAATATGSITLDAHPEVWMVIDRLASRSLSGDAARQAVDLLLTKSLDMASAALVWRIIKKDLRAGFSESTINKAAPGTIPEFPYMRCTLPAKSNMDKWNWLDGIFSQIKADGAFANVNVDDTGAVSIHTRQGTPYPADALGIEGQIANTLANGAQSHGELLVYENGVAMSRQAGNGVLNSLLSGGALEENQEVHFFIWDQIPLSAVKPKGRHLMRYRVRFTNVLKQLKAMPASQLHPIETRICHTKARAYDHNRDALRRGLEGTVCKHPDMEWYDTGSGGSKDQVKLKVEFTVELRIKGFVPGEGKNAATFGSLACESECGKLKVNVSGFSDALRAKIHADREGHLDGIAAVTSNSIMPPKDADSPASLFLPRLSELRTDKSTADSLDSIRAQYDALVAA